MHAIADSQTYTLEGNENMIFYNVDYHFLTCIL